MSSLLAMNCSSCNLTRLSSEGIFRSNINELDFCTSTSSKSKIGIKLFSPNKTLETQRWALDPRGEITI